jgi:capsule polysaccharide export protein KpsE/RkpR
MLQALVRGFMVRKELEMKSHYAVAIQSMYRCKIARDEVHARQEAKVRELEEQLRKAAVTDELASTEATEARGENYAVKHGFGETPEESVEIAEVLVASEVADLKSELAKMKAELKATKKAVTKSKARIAELEAENKTMKQQMGQGTKAEQYADHPDLHKLAEGIFGLTYRSKQSKSDLDALVKALKVLK